MRFTMSSRLVAALSCLLLLSTLLLSVTAAPVPSSSAGLQQEGVVADARVAAREVSSSTRSASAPSQEDVEKRSSKGLMKRSPEPKRFSLDDFTTIAAAADKYDGLKPEGAGFVGLKQRGLPGWSRIF
ncbi:hypothetical protein UCRNP2_2688 [Neofusicoccum parvum UCRNP2]|uniref:Uncharacterized protein n=1 Tax=Botryosphaeria parva (strain UCR-NP2) TaxID=1287680 RepID=R1ERZ8_BOTPV|nr:hypothetical protein UCRNP2_2688 [Neofusicoccum parvum UCRNP2]